MKSVVVDLGGYDWEGDRPLGRPFRETVIYEAHLAGFTADPTRASPPGRRGTYAGFIEKIPYLVELGITAVELLPVFPFDPPRARRPAWPTLGLPDGLVLRARTGVRQPARRRTAAVDEFRDLVKALHRAGIEVILDVVYNHTAEAARTARRSASAASPTTTTTCSTERPARYNDYTGSGNTLNANHPVVRRLILDSLRYWVQEMHVDGFRFDLAAVLSRDEAGSRCPTRRSSTTSRPTRSSPGPS